ncbi:hypothetical protein SAMN05192533_102316 [Mesobacillus persicus]|uniref:Uncharacterized protein n=1 Tax=Mesobacillus persicus TaxID=930146 RepID=A0A1H7XQD4_9BACI|nr:hypothetical protein [Mesobacillus persicus]SEM35951.1 hypothetical protein SAMN05192533_102316 [Mesobacillus persicus]
MSWEIRIRKNKYIYFVLRYYHAQKTKQLREEKMEEFLLQELTRGEAWDKAVRKVSTKYTYKTIGNVENPSTKEFIDREFSEEEKQDIYQKIHEVQKRILLQEEE